MTPRQPQENADEEVQNEILQAVHEALDDPAQVKTLADDQLLAATQQDAPLLQEVKEPAAADARVEIDRIEMYLKGPTAFTA